MAKQSTDPTRDTSRGQETEYAKRRKIKGGGPVWVKKEPYALCKKGAQKADTSITDWVGLAIEEKAERDGIEKRQARGWRRHGPSSS